MAHDEQTAANLRGWDDIFRSRAWGRYPPEDLVRFVARNFYGAPDRSAVRMLEIGSGPGANVWFMAREGFSVSAIEGSSGAVEQLKQRLEAEAIPFQPDEIKVGNFATLPWPDASFDAVIDIQAMGHNPIAVVRQVLSEVRRVLKPGGLFLSKSFGIRTTGAGTGQLIEPYTSIGPDGPLNDIGLVHFFSAEELDELYSGFASVHRDWVHRQDGSRGEFFEWVTTARI